MTPLNFRELTRPLRHLVGAFALDGFRRALGWISYPTACRLGRVLGRLAWEYLAHDRATTLDNLRRSHPERSGRWVIRTGRAVFERTGLYTAATLYVAFVDFRWFERTIDGRDWYAYARSRDPCGPGAVIVVPHFGMFLLAAAVGPRAMRFEAMARPPRLRFAADLAHELFRRIGFRTHDQGSNLLGLVHRMKEGVSLAMVADHDVRRIGGAFVPFLGRLAYTPTGPVAAATMAQGELVVVVPVPDHSARNSLPHFRLRVHRVPLQHTGDRRVDLAENTRRWSSVIEAYVRAYPEEWSWMNRRWRTRPTDRDRAPVWSPTHDRTGWTPPDVDTGAPVRPPGIAV